MGRAAGEDRRSPVRMPGVVMALALAGGACGDAAVSPPTLIEDFRQRAAILSCGAVPGLTRLGLVVDDIVATPGGDLLVLSGRARNVLLVGSDLEVRWTLDLPEDGPGGVGSPVSADLLGDTTLLVADRGRQLLKRLDLRGGDPGTVRTPFSPALVRVAGDDVYVVPTILGGFPDRLLYRIEGDAVVPEALQPRRFPGMTHGAFANRLGALREPGGGITLVHGFYVPEAYRWDRGEVGRYRVPVPDAVSDVFRASRPVEREEDLAHLPVVALSPHRDPHTGDIVFLTRTGEAAPDGTQRKALVRVNGEFRHLRSGILPVDAFLAAPVSSGGTLVVDDEGRWHRCETP